MLRRLVIAVVLLCLGSAAALARDVRVFAAASLAETMDEVAAAYQAATGESIVSVYAGSSTLARQIETGARADIFISADEEWMDYLAARRLIDKQSRRSLLTNELVLVMPVDKLQKVEIARGTHWLASLPEGRIAVGDPAHVPVGKYARSALQALGVWPAVSRRLVTTADTRAALALAERGEAAAAIVYRTDSASSTKVAISGVFPREGRAPISYPVAITAGGETTAARAVYAFVCGLTARAIFKKHGFRSQ